MRKLIIIQILISFFVFLSINSFSQRIYVEGNKLMMNGSQIYMNGCNTPWDNWNDFGGTYDPTFWEAEFQRLEDNGINSTRIWFSCSGEVDPQINASGQVTGASAAFWANCDDLFARAQAHGIYVMATMMSFDHTKNTYTTYTRWRAMLNSQANVQTYIDNYLIPFVVRYQDNPYLFNIDLCNEMEWINQNAEEGQLAWTVLQRYAAMCAAAIHKSTSPVTVSLGSAAVKWGSDAKNIQGSQYVGNCEGNVWSDAKLQAQFNDPEAFLDIWQVHYYDWINSYYSNPFTVGPAGYNLNDRPCLIGEMPGRETLMGFTTTMAQCFEASYNLGYSGHYPWTSNNAGSGDFGSLSTFGAAALTFKNNHTALVYPPVLQCKAPALGNDMTLCGATYPLVLNSNTTAKTNVTYKWYKDGVLISGATSPTYTINSATGAAGTYKVVRDSLSCSREDEIILTSTLPSFNLGSDIALCNPASATLNVSVSGNGITYVWSKNGTTIPGATTNSYTVYNAGTYRATINASGCSAKYDEVIVTSSLPLVQHDTICAAGTATLNVLSTGGSYEWFAASTGGTALATGQTYSPSVTTNKTYYVADASSVNITVGPTAASHTLTGAQNGGSIGIKFTTTKACKITQVKVLPFVYTCNGDQINVTMTLQNSGGTAISTHTSSSVSCTAVQSTAPFDDYYTLTFSPAIDITAAGSYRLVPTAGNQLVWFTSGANFTTMDASGAGIIDITDDTRDDQATSFPGIFDIVVQTGTSCARTPVLAVIDPSANGCAPDSDGDGTPDATDGCPNDPNKILPGSCGCGAVDTDSDSDGTPDCNDQCQNDPNKIVPGECGCGTEEGTCSVNYINLKKGWNLIGCPINGTTNIQTALASIWSDLLVLKDGNGFYLSTQATFLNSLNTVTYGRGYLVKVAQDCQLTWQ